MSIRDVGQCGPRCRQEVSCEKCGGKCLPRYLCVNATIVADPYDTSCRCDSIDQRIFPSDCGWYGMVSCGQDSLTVYVTIEKSYPSGDCQTRVEIPEIDVNQLFDGVLRDLYVEGTNDSGIMFEVTIGEAFVFLNPRAFGNCPLCKCATCLPKAFCLTLTDTESNVFTATTNWACESEKYGPTTINGRSVEINLLHREDEQGCALQVLADGGVAIIQLESEEISRVGAKGITCLEATGTLLRGKDPSSLIEQPGILTTTINLYDGETFAGTLFVKEKGCDGDCYGCADKPNHGLCCDYLPPTLTMTVRCTSDAAVPCDETQTQTVSWSGGYTGTFNFCDLPPGITIVADCEDDLVTQSEWTLSLTIPTIGGSSKRLANTIPCPGILLIATFTQAKDYGPPIGIVTYTFEITVTL